MSALETYLKEAKDIRGMWHKGRIRDIRSYIAITPRTEIITAIRMIKDQTLLRILWEVGLDYELQRVVILHSERLEKEAKGGE